MFLFLKDVGYTVSNWLSGDNGYGPVQLDRSRQCTDSATVRLKTAERVSECAVAAFGSGLSETGCGWKRNGGTLVSGSSVAVDAPLGDRFAQP
jgi:hypothetical protein